MKYEMAVEAGSLLDRATDQLMQMLRTVKTEAPDEHLGYVALVAPALEGVFSMAAVIWREHPALAPSEPASAAPMEYDQPTDDRYRLADSMSYVTAAQIAQMAEAAGALVREAARLFHAECAADELATIESAQNRAEAAIAAIGKRLTSQHPGLVAP